MKLNLNIEIDTDNVKDEEKLEEILAVLAELKELISEARDGKD